MALTRGVTLKSVTLALILIPINCYWIMYTEMVWWNKTVVGIGTRRAARYLCDALYGECDRITRPRAGAYSDDRTRLLV